MSGLCRAFNTVRYAARPGVQRVVLGIAMPWFLFFSSPVWPASTVTNEFSALDASIFHWDELQEMYLFGIPVHVREFTSAESIQRAGATIASHTDRFQRVIALKDKIVLSGTKSDWHWMAEIQSVSGGARGMVSAMRINPEQLSDAVKNKAGNAFPWLAQGARLRFSQRLVVKDRRITQQVYSTGLSKEQLAAYVNKNLRLAGWRHQPRPAWLPDADAWMRAGSRLLVVSKGDTAGSALFIHHIE